MNTNTTAQSESATDEEEPSTGLSSLPSSLDSDSSLYVQRKELWPLPDSSDEEQYVLSDEEPALQSTATSGATASASGATDVPDTLQCDICQQVCALYKCCIPPQGHEDRLCVFLGLCSHGLCENGMCSQFLNHCSDRVQTSHIYLTT